jgi:hypothetical protein
MTTKNTNKPKAKINKRGNLVEYEDMEYTNRIIEEVENEREGMRENSWQSKNAMKDRFQNDENLPTNKNTVQTNEDGWITPSAIASAKEKKHTSDEVSTRFLPVNLPLFESEIHNTTPTKYVLPITITIKSKRNSNHTYKGTRLLVALSKAFQMAYQDSYIGPLNTGSRLQLIAHHEQVPMEQSKLHKYMMDTMVGINKTYSTKIIVHANNELKDFINNQNFRDYLNSELISIEYNNLDCVIPCNVGYIEHVTATRDNTLMHHAQIKKCLPDIAPHFQVILYKVQGLDNRSTYLVMVQSRKEDVSQLSRMLLQVEDKNKVTFFPWQSFQAVTDTKRQTLINDYKRWNTTFKSFLADGFKDNEQDVIMGTPYGNKEYTDQEKGLHQLTVSDYLRQIVHPISKLKMFDYVYPAVLGKREFIISVDTYGDVESFLSVIQGELARIMDPTSIQKEFQSPFTAISQMNEPDWTPFTRASTIKDTVIIQMSKNFNKRTRTSNDNGSQSRYEVKSEARSVTPYRKKDKRFLVFSSSPEYYRHECHVYTHSHCSQYR